jgi:4'-phosphopantetheinyl transferase
VLGFAVLFVSPVTADVMQVVIVGSGPTMPVVAELSEMLDESEKRRARQLLALHRHAGFVTARAALRVVLGRHLGISPTEVPIEEGPHGKPVLSCGTPYFNLAHTEGLITVAVRETGPVGIDVETTQRQAPSPATLRRTLTDAERRALEGLSPTAAKSAFLRAWSRKEAYAKGLSVGLALDFGRLHVGWDDVTVCGDPPWEIRSLSLPAPHVGAVAARGQRWRVRAEAFDWQLERQFYQ